MKRNELLKKTGICITALSLCAALFVCTPAVNAFAENHDDFSDGSIEFDPEWDMDQNGWDADDSFDSSYPDAIYLEPGEGTGEPTGSPVYTPTYTLDPTGKYYIDEYGNYYDMNFLPVAPPAQTPAAGTGITDETGDPTSGQTGAAADPGAVQSTSGQEGTAADPGAVQGTDSSGDTITIVDPSTGNSYTENTADDDAANSSDLSAAQETGSSMTPTSSSSTGGSAAVSTGSGSAASPSPSASEPDTLTKPGNTNDSNPATNGGLSAGEVDPFDVPPPLSLFPGFKTVLQQKVVLKNGLTAETYEEAANFTGSNEALIASQNIISGLSIIHDDFRFYTVKKDLAFTKDSTSLLEGMTADSREVGLLPKDGALYVLNEENDGWIYAESGNVRGFIKADQILRGEDADEIVTNLTGKSGSLVRQGSEIDAFLSFAAEKIPAEENRAFTYRRCTTKSTVIDKDYAVASVQTSILEEAAEGAREIGRLSPGSLCYVILQANDKWLYVESDNVRGFVPAADLTTGEAAKDIVKEKGEANMPVAEQLVVPKENKALYYSLNSVRDGTVISKTRTDIVQAAAEYIGTPYVWGGNDLRKGIDCSGFVKEIYAMFGYDIPRTASEQSTFGTQIPVADAAPGDLIFFAENGYVYHVALYAGDGTTIEAYNIETGVIATDIGNRDAVWATRVIND